MASATEEFFAALAGRGEVPELSRVNATVRYEIRHDRQADNYLVTVADGVVTVAPGAADAPADCQVYADRAEFDRILSGETNPMAASLRGVISVEGDRELLVLFRRIFRGGAPRPGGRARSGRKVSGGGARRRGGDVEGGGRDDR